MIASAERRFSRSLYILRLAGLILLFLAYVLPHLLSKLLFGKSRWPVRFLRHAGLIVGVRPRLHGDPIASRSLLIANHSSWLDIILLGGWCGAAFVSKAEVRSTPILGWIADQNRTLYIDRGARRDSREQVRRIRDALDHPQPLTVFPEGTTGNGRDLLPFRSTLLEAVAPAPPGITVRPVAIDFGHHADLVGWHGGEPGMVNFKRILGQPGSIPVLIRILDSLPREEDRKLLANRARTAIGEALSSVDWQDTL